LCALHCFLKGTSFLININHPEIVNQGQGDINICIGDKGVLINININIKEKLVSNVDCSLRNDGGHIVRITLQLPRSLTKLLMGTRTTNESVCVESDKKGGLIPKLGCVVVVCRGVTIYLHARERRHNREKKKPMVAPKLATFLCHLIHKSGRRPPRSCSIYNVKMGRWESERREKRDCAGNWRGGFEARRNSMAVNTHATVRADISARWPHKRMCNIY